MKRVLKWMGIILGGLIFLVVVAAVGLSVVGASRLGRTRDLQVEFVTVPADEAGLARGEHLVEVACKSCHGANLTGQPMLDEAPIGTIYATNITGLGGTHTDADLVRAIRHGLDTDGRQLMIMPAESFIYFSEEDLGAVIGYLKTVPAAGEETPPPQMGPLGRVLLGAGLFGDVFPAEYIDHDAPFPEMPEIGANVAYGAYAAGFCSSCHGSDLAGGQPADPQSPPAPALTTAGRLGSWTEEEFVTAMRTGSTPDGRQLDATFMPWESFGKFDDDELRGLWIYLQTLPAGEAAAE